MKNTEETESRAFAHILIVTTIVLFSVLLSALNVSMGWEKWMLPLFAGAVVLTLAFHITGSLSYELRLYVYCGILFLEMFYYIAKISVIHDSTPVILFILTLLAAAHEKRLIWGCTAVAAFSILFRVFVSYGTLDSFLALKTGLNLLLVIITSIMLTRMLSTYANTERFFLDRIGDLETETKSAGDFLANVSHELRTPINAVTGLTDLCIEKEKDPVIKRDLQSVSEAGVRVAGQISDILDYSEIERDKLTVNPDEYTMSSLLGDLVAELRPYKRADLELVIDVDPSLPEIMRTDTGKLKKILWHVIVNGLKYTRDGGVYVYITYTRQSYGMNLCVDVTDTGIGMTEEERERAFDRFYQSDSGRTRTIGGLGLGLSIVKGFVRSLGGFLTIETKEQKGTTVHICIPQGIVSNSECMSVRERDRLILGTFFQYSKYPNPDVRDYYDNMIRNTARGLRLSVHRIDSMEDLEIQMRQTRFTHIITGAEEYRLNESRFNELAGKLILVIVCDDDFVLPEDSMAVTIRKPFYCFPLVNVLNMDREDLREGPKRMYLNGIRALVVDDEPMNLTVATRIFRRYGMTVDTALSGQEAIDICKRKKYDIIFMDHMMPQMDGVETARRIRAEAGLGRQDTAFVALTANAVSTAREMFMAEGFNGFVSKPVVMSELERVLKGIFPVSAITYGEDVPAEALEMEEAFKKDELDILRDGGITVENGLDYCMGDRELYKEVLIEYALDGEIKKTELEGYMGDRSWDDFRIRVHAVKSSSKTIGAEKLFRSAEMLEEASRDHKEETIMLLYPEFLTEYNRVTELIRSIYDVRAAEDDAYEI